MTNLFDLKGKKALVTGADSGLGSGMAEGLLEVGAEVVLAGSSDKPEKKAAEFRALDYLAHAVRGDLLHKEDIFRIFDDALSLLGGRIDILINNAGIQRFIPVFVLSFSVIYYKYVYIKHKRNNVILCTKDNFLRVLPSWKTYASREKCGTK